MAGAGGRLLDLWRDFPGNVAGNGASITNNGMGINCLQLLGSELLHHRGRVDGPWP